MDQLIYFLTLISSDRLPTVFSLFHARTDASKKTLPKVILFMVANSVNGSSFPPQKHLPKCEG